MLGEVGDLGLVVRWEVPVVYRGAVVVRVVVVLAPRVVVPLDDARGVDRRDAVPVLVELHEAVEAKVEEGEEGGHADQGLEEDEKHKARALGHQQERCGHVHPVVDAPGAELVVHALALGGGKVAQGRVAAHVQHDAVHVEHEVRQGGPVQVPLVEGVAHAPVQLVVDVHVRRLEVVWHVAVKHAELVLKPVAHKPAEPALVEHHVVALLVRHGVRRAHGPAPEAHPLAVVGEDHPPGQVPVRELLAEEHRERDEHGGGGQDGHDEEVVELLLGVHVLGREGAQGRHGVEPLEQRAAHLDQTVLV
mmetsp:Transcript_3441/g.11451  ORF Transcript_3441/g.11451 Transcript_3441/m.11451 type:complete len:305 (-) Transcript_3441:194-1108(-)